MTAAQISGAPGSLWTQVIALNPNYRGVTPAVFANAMAGQSTDLLNIVYDETEALFADLSWNVTDKLTLAFGLRSQEDTHTRHGPDSARHDDYQHGRGVRVERSESTACAIRSGYTAINSPLVGASKFEGTPARLSVQYQLKEELMGHIAPRRWLSARRRHAGAGQHPGARCGGRCDGRVYCATSTTTTARSSICRIVLVRGEQTVDNFEIGTKRRLARGPAAQQRGRRSKRTGRT